jgi:hypothetical protein
MNTERAIMLQATKCTMPSFSAGESFFNQSINRNNSYLRQEPAKKQVKYAKIRLIMALSKQLMKPVLALRSCINN